MRVIMWVFLGLVLSLVPLVIVAFMTFQPGHNSLLTILSNEELLAVAFTLSGAAAADVLVNVSSAAGGFAKFAKGCVGCATFVLTVLTAAAYVLLKAHSTQLTPPQIVGIIQLLYAGTAVMSFLCELLS
jgi:hypothetical protein